MEDRIALTLHDDGVADVRLNRPEKMNALDTAMFRGIIEAGERLRGMVALRAVVLSGEGRAFCAGLDMQSFQRMGSDERSGSTASPVGSGLSERTHGISNAAQQVAMIWRELPVPVIAAVHGVAFGGGLQVALGADLRFVRRMRGCRSWRSNGVWSPIWQAW
jgi:enoyl-CoA hydratase/carnithine racemase